MTTPRESIALSHEFSLIETVVMRGKIQIGVAMIFSSHGRALTGCVTLARTALLLLLATLSTSCVRSLDSNSDMNTALSSPTASFASPADIRGVSWSDPQDNYQLGPIVPANLSLHSLPDEASATARRMAGHFKKAGANLVRLGINPATVEDATWWQTYERVIRVLSDEGLGVLLCAWETSPAVHIDDRKSHNGRFGREDIEAYAQMWKHVHERLLDIPNVMGYELLNEPFGYRGRVEEYVGDMRRLMRAIGDDLRGRRIIVAGIGYADDVQVLKVHFPERHVWFSYHVYVNWYGGWGENLISREAYAKGLADAVEGVESRTLITEFGSWGGLAYDYSIAPDPRVDINVRQHVAYLQGIADTIQARRLGSVYWTANANAKPNDRSYDLFREDGTIHDPDQFAQVRRAWRLHD